MYGRDLKKQRKRKLQEIQLDKDIEFAKVFDPLPSFSEFKEQVKNNYDLKKVLRNFLTTMSQIGILDFGKLTKEKLITVARDGKNKPITPQEYSEKCDKYWGKTIKFGQYATHYNVSSKFLDGIGRKVKIDISGSEMWEGEFVNDELHGFGRYVSTFGNGDFDGRIGTWR